MLITLDPSSSVSLSRQLYEHIKSRILAGKLLAEERLPSSRFLASELGIARNTVLEAYDQLIAEGFLVSRQGSGTIVAPGVHPNPTYSNSPKDGEDKHASSMWDRQQAPKNTLINFRSGIPALEAFPKEEWAKCYQRTAQRLPAAAFRYCEPGGIRELRQAIAAYLSRMRGIRVSPHRIMITSGSTQALSLLSRLLRPQGETVLVEDPAHTGLVAVLARAGFTLTGINVDEYGMDTDLLAQHHGEDASRIAFVYLTPSHQYPLGGILPIQRRQALIRFAAQAKCAILEDDYDSEFRHEGLPVSSLFELDPDTVIYLGSFSKILAPALRMGFAIIPERMLEAWSAEKMYMDVHTDAISQYALAEFINEGCLEKHIWKMRKLYKRKRAHLIQCLASQFGKTFSVKGEATGLHLVASFQQAVFTTEIMDELLDRGVKVSPVEAYSLFPNGAHSNELVLGYSHLTQTEIASGIRIIHDVINQHNIERAPLSTSRSADGGNR